LEERLRRDNGVKDFGDEVESFEPVGDRIDSFLKMRGSKNELI
jgi:hypothetical protein